MTLKGRSVVIQFLKVHYFLILDNKDIVVYDLMLLKQNKKTDKNTPSRFKEWQNITKESTHLTSNFASSFSPTKKQLIWIQKSTM